MGRRSEKEITPRNGKVLVVGIVARISGCQNQKELSLEDQLDHGKEVACELYSGPIEYRTISTKGKGERLDRPELIEIEELLRSEELDLLIFEDVGRLVRGPAAHPMCGIAVDYGVRVISPNDYFDTAEENWEEVVLDACKEHMQHNAHTSRRLKHKLMNRFRKLGGATPLPIYGYFKPPGATTFSEWTKQEDANRWIEDGFRLLRETLNAEKVAEFFNDHSVPTGPYCRKKKWDGRMVLRYFRNPILIGRPGRGFRKSVKHNESGRRKSLRNPDGPVYREEPHLAFLDVAEWEAWMADQQEHNKRYKRKGVNGKDTRKGVLKSRTRPLGQHVRCWYCGAHYVWGGNGITDHLMCSASREWRCWNSIGFDGPLATRSILGAISNKLQHVDGVAEQYGELLQAALRGNGDDERVRADLDRRQAALEQEKRNLKAAILASGSQPLLEEMLWEHATKERELAVEWRQLERRKQKPPQVPSSPSELRLHLSAELDQLASDSWELGNLLRLLAPEIHVYLVRLCDGGHLLPRAKVKLNLLGSFSDAIRLPGLAELLSEVVTLDFFNPPEREQVREECVRLTAQNMRQSDIATQLPNQPTQALVSKSVQLDQRMRELGLTSPYLLVNEPPDDYAKLRRHRNHKYLFTPVDGYERPER